MCLQGIIKFFKCGCCKKGADAAPSPTNGQNLQADADSGGHARSHVTVQMHAVRVDVAPAPPSQQARGHHKYTSTMVDLRDALRTPAVEDDAQASPVPASMLMG